MRSVDLKSTHSLSFFFHCISQSLSCLSSVSYKVTISVLGHYKLKGQLHLNRNTMLRSHFKEIIILFNLGSDVSGKIWILPKSKIQFYVDISVCSLHLLIFVEASKTHLI